MAGFTHLRVTSCYSFLRGLGHPEQYVERAAELGYEALALCEEDYLCALPRFEAAARAAGLRPLLGATVNTTAGPLSLLCRDRAGYAQICRLLSRMHLAPVPESRRAEALSSRGGLPADETLLAEELGGDHLLVLTGGRRGRLARLLRAGDEAAAETWLRWLSERVGRRGVVVELQRLGCLGDHRLSLQQAQLARRLGLRSVATGDVRYVHRRDFPLYDLLACTRRLQTVDSVYPGRPVSDLQYLASETAMRRRFDDLPEALAETCEIAAECTELRLGDERYLPRYNGVPPTEQNACLARLAEQGVRERYPRGDWPAVRARVAEELRIIAVLELAGYFLLVWDACRWARAEGIRCAGRGSAAGSVVCYALRITNVDAWRRDIPVARFLNEQRRDSLPDIDVDFARRGRDRVIDYLAARYGAEQVAMTGTYARYHARSAIRDLGRALALPPDEIDRLAKSLPRLGCDQLADAEVKYPDVRHSPWADSRYRQLHRLLPGLAGVPRHLGTHLGGVILAPTPLCEAVVVQHAGKPWRVVQGDKEDVEDRFCKFDCLSLPMFDVIEDANRFVQKGRPEFEIFSVPLDDPATYARLRRSETIGAFEVGSPAQRALHARLRCDCFEPLVAALALIRPGPIKGHVVEHYLARRDGDEPIDYGLPALEPILARTYGLMVYQEQVIDVARVVAGLTPAEADLLRRSISHYRSEEAMRQMGEQFCAKATANGVAPATAARIFETVRGFAGYGFCESHAAAFADTAYRSVYLLEHHPAEYFAGLLRHQPMGFYPLHTIVSLARRRGLEVRGPCINTGPARTEAEGTAIRVGLAQVNRVSEAAAERIVAGRPYRRLGELQRGTGLPRDRLSELIRAGACDGLCDHRRALLWQLQELPQQAPGVSELPLPPDDPVPDPRLPRGSAWDRLAGEWDALGFGVAAHPLDEVRDWLERSGVQPIAAVLGAAPGTRHRVAGLVIRPHRPPTRTGRNTLFFDLEDETGLISITCFQRVYQNQGQVALHHAVVMVDGAIDERTGRSLIAQRLQPIERLGDLASSHARTLY